jgi:drug/metabolite transporter (DMT)-like permease
MVLVSGFIHASWNILARRSGAETQFISRMLPILAGVGLVPALIGQYLTGSVRGWAWVYVLGSGLCCGFYFVSLGRAYESADFTTVYPVARALPVLLVAVGDSLRGIVPSGLGWLGMAMVVSGCIVAPLRTRRDLRLGQYFNRASLWMVLTALGTVGYSLLDKRGAELLIPGPVSAVIYSYFFYAFAFVGYEIFSRVMLSPARRAAPPTTPLWLPTTAGFMSYAAYVLVVWAFQMVPHASYVVAFRQSSLIIAVLMAFALYAEERHWSRLISVLIITAGLVLITLGG